MSNPSPSELRFRREWAKLVGKRRLSAFELALTDPDLVSLKQELVKIDLRIADLEEKAAEGETREGWKEVSSLTKQINAELSGSSSTNPLPDLDKLRRLAGSLATCAEQGEQDWRTWDEVVRLIEQRRKLSDTERKFEELRNYKVPATEVLRLLDDLHAAIEAVVADRTTRFQIFHEVRLRANGESSTRARMPLTLPAAYMADPPLDSGYADDDPDAVEVQQQHSDGDAGPQTLST